MCKFEIWLRQTSTIHAIGVAAFVLGGAIAQITTGNPTWDAIIGVIAYILVHLGIDDHSAKQQAMTVLATDAVQAAQGKSVPPAKILADGIAAAKAFETVTVHVVGDPQTKE